MYITHSDSQIHLKVISYTHTHEATTSPSTLFYSLWMEKVPFELELIGNDCQKHKAAEAQIILKQSLMIHNPTAKDHLALKPNCFRCHITNHIAKAPLSRKKPNAINFFPALHLILISSHICFSLPAKQHAAIHKFLRTFSLLSPQFTYPMLIIPIRP